jgi:hypothetical protein
MRTVACVLFVSATASASPWQTRCTASLDAARKAAAKLAPELGKVAVTPDKLGSEEQVAIKLGGEAGLPSVVSAHAGARNDASDWESTDETTSTGEYHLVASRRFADGGALVMLTMWKKPVAQQLAQLFKPALEKCFAGR